MIPKNKLISVLHPYVNKKGGAVKMMILLSNLLKEEGNDLIFYTFSYNKELFSGDINFKIKAGNKLSIAYRIRKSDYIIVGNSPMQFVAVLSKILFFSKAKIIWRHHHYPWYYGRNTNFLILLKRYLEKLSMKFIDIVLVNSKYLQTSLKKIYDIDSKILYPVLDKEFLEKPSFENKDYSNKVIFAYARWEQGKNLEQVFNTYSTLKEKIPNLELLVGGLGEELDFFKEKFKTDNEISFLGLLNTKSIIKYLQKSLILLFPSKIDSFGITIIEAQSQGVPVIAFDLNGAKEIIINNKTGFLVKTSKEFTEKTELLLNDYALYKSFQEKAFESSNRFTISNFKKQLSNIF